MPRGLQPKPIPIAPHIWASKGRWQARCVHCGRYAEKRNLLALGYTITALPQRFPGNKTCHTNRTGSARLLRQILAKGPKSINTIKTTTRWTVKKAWSAVWNLNRSRMITIYGDGRERIFLLNQCGLRALAEDRRRGVI